MGFSSFIRLQLANKISFPIRLNGARWVSSNNTSFPRQKTPGLHKQQRPEGPFSLQHLQCLRGTSPCATVDPDICYCELKPGCNVKQKLTASPLNMGICIFIILLFFVHFFCNFVKNYYFVSFAAYHIYL